MSEILLPGGEQITAGPKSRSAVKGVEVVTWTNTSIA
jgi:hypothetical protein